MVKKSWYFSQDQKQHPQKERDHKCQNQPHQPFPAVVGSVDNASYSDGGRRANKNLCCRVAANHRNVERAGVEERSHFHAGRNADCSRALV